MTDTKNVCPFCGSDRLIPCSSTEDFTDKFVECDRCHAHGPIFDVPEEDSLNDDEETDAKAITAFCIPAHFAERVKAELVPVAVAKTEAERLRVAGVGDVVTLDDGRRVRVEIFELGKKCCELCVFSADEEACNATPCFIGARPIHRDSVYFEEVSDE